MTGMTVIVKTVTRWTAALIFLYGAYLVAYGHLGPGGGFAGGVILACAYVIVMLAFGKEEAQRDMPHQVVAKLDSVGALLFLALALGGLLLFDVFFLDWVLKLCPGGEQYRLFSGGIIPLANIAIAVKVFSALFLVFTILATMRGIRDKDQEFQSDEVD